MLSNTKWNISGLKVNWTQQNTQLTFLLSAKFLVAELYAQPFFLLTRKLNTLKTKDCSHLKKTISKGYYIPYLVSKVMGSNSAQKAHFLLHCVLFQPQLRTIT
jgi:hypothetical protein